MAELRQLLTEKGLDAKGKAKRDLVNRLLANPVSPKWHLGILAPQFLWTPIYARFAKSSADRLKPKALVLEPKLQVWVASAGASSEPKCGRATKSGGFCNISAPCKCHKSQADEENTMTAEDKQSCKIERGTCDVTLRDGEDICDNIKGRCDWHAPDSQRCQSMIEREPERRCWNYRQEASDYCRDHHEFPNVSVNAKAYGEDCCRDPKKVCEHAKTLRIAEPLSLPQAACSMAIEHVLWP